MRHRVGIAVLIIIASFFLSAYDQPSEARSGDPSDPLSAGGFLSAVSQLLNPGEGAKASAAINTGNSSITSVLADEEVMQNQNSDYESPVIFTGIVEEISPEFWLIGGHRVRITKETEIVGEPSIGDLVQVHGFKRDDFIVAVSIQPHEGPINDREVEFIGRVQEMGERIWLIGDRRVLVTERTEIVGDIRVGDLVKVHGLRWFGRLTVAHEIKLIERPTHENEAEFTGRVQEMGDRIWLIGDHRVRITEDTEIIGDIIVGDFVKVQGFLGDQGLVIARVITLLERPPQDREVDFRGRVQEKGDRFWLIGEHRVRITEDTKIDGDIRVGDIVRVQGYLGDEGLVIARVITLLERPPQDREVDFRGRVQEKGDRFWLIGDHRVRITENTEIIGDIILGDIVLVHGIISDGEGIVAHHIKLLEHAARDSEHDANRDEFVERKEDVVNAGD